MNACMYVCMAVLTCHADFVPQLSEALHDEILMLRIHLRKAILVRKSKGDNDKGGKYGEYEDSGRVTAPRHRSP